MLSRLVPRLSSIGSRRWIATLSAMTAVTALSIDMSLPAQPTLATVFDVSSETAQLTLSLFLIAFAAAQLVTGYVSDALGRRPVLIAGLVLFALSGVACALSPSIEVLLACRVVQGFGAAAAPVVARAMVRDTQPAHQAARLLSTMLAALAVAPMIAPQLGSWLLELSNWRAIFVALAVCGVILLVLAAATLPETHAHDRRITGGGIRGLFRGFREFFRTPGTRLPVFVSCATFAGQFAYISDSPFVLMEGYHVSPRHYAYYFGATALALMIGSLAGRAILRAGQSPRLLLRVGTLLLLVGGIAVVIGTHGGFGLAGFFVPMLVYFIGVGLTSPSATALAMEPVPHLAGTASAAVGSLQMTCGAIAGYATTRIGGSSPLVFADVVVVMGAIAFALAFAARRGVPTRILPPPS
ncbi:MAG TPA: multidrug effflux MFS transporter [Kofleriaceae bacterium]|nr:multidrug effflux MFS transporter [Kofleriaceae bacterium]